MTTVLEQHRIPRGFTFAAGTAGIKASGRPDVALIEAPGGATAAAMFTRNRVAAAPVVLGRRHLLASRGTLRAIVVNAGNANCATGADGMRAALPFVDHFGPAHNLAALEQLIRLVN